MASFKREDYKLSFDFNYMMEEFMGKEGITEKEIKAADSKSAFEKVKAGRGKGMQCWTELPYADSSKIDNIIDCAKDIRRNFKYFVVLGIGGSALGPIALQQSVKHLHYNELNPKRRNGPKIYVEDNIDPERMSALFDMIVPEETMFNVITKSGNTSETMSQFLIIFKILKEKLGDGACRNIIATTDAVKGNLAKIAKEENIRTFVIPDGVGGRFSELSPVGLLPAAVAGINIKMLLNGARYMDKLCSSSNVYKNPALMAAVQQYIAMGRGKNISVMMPYADSLKFISDWYCQLWGESLGKAVDLNGNTVNAGQTPVKALGVTDQHSQIQLYTEGPFDKVITFIGVENFRTEVKIENVTSIKELDFLNTTLNELINTERKATEYALKKAGRLNRTIMLPAVNEFTIGEILMFFMLETAYCGALLNIDTFNQPGVEEGKNATYALMGRKGYDEKRKELETAPVKNPKYII